MAGVPEKIVDYLLETRVDAQVNDGGIDTVLEDFLLTHSIYIPPNVLCKYLKNYYMQRSVTGVSIFANAFILIEQFNIENIKMFAECC